MARCVDLQFRDPRADSVAQNKNHQNQTRLVPFERKRLDLLTSVFVQRKLVLLMGPGPRRFAALLSLPPHAARRHGVIVGVGGGVRFEGLGAEHKEAQESRSVPQGGGASVFPAAVLGHSGL